MRENCEPKLKTPAVYHSITAGYCQQQRQDIKQPL